MFLSQHYWLSQHNTFYHDVWLTVKKDNSFTAFPYIFNLLIKTITNEIVFISAVTKYIPSCVYESYCFENRAIEPCAPPIHTYFVSNLLTFSLCTSSEDSTGKGNSCFPLRTGRPRCQESSWNTNTRKMKMLENTEWVKVLWKCGKLVENY